MDAVALLVQSLPCLDGDRDEQIHSSKWLKLTCFSFIMFMGFNLFFWYCFRILLGKLVSQFADCSFGFGKFLSILFIISCWWHFLIILQFISDLPTWVVSLYFLCIGSWVFWRIRYSVPYQVSCCWKVDIRNSFLSFCHYDPRIYNANTCC